MRQHRIRRLGITRTRTSRRVRDRRASRGQVRSGRPRSIPTEHLRHVHGGVTGETQRLAADAAPGEKIAKAGVERRDPRVQRALIGAEAAGDLGNLHPVGVPHLNDRAVGGIELPQRVGELAPYAGAEDTALALEQLFERVRVAGRLFHGQLQTFLNLPSPVTGLASVSARCL